MVMLCVHLNAIVQTYIHQTILLFDCFLMSLATTAVSRKSFLDAQHAKGTMGAFSTNLIDTFKDAYMGTYPKITGF